MYINDQSTVFLCKYRIKNFNIMNGDTHIDMGPSNIMSLEYICDYDGALFAILKVSLRIDSRKKIYILKHKRDIEVKVELEKIGYDVNLDETVTNAEEVFNEVFSAYFNDDDENLDVQTMEERLNANETLDEAGTLDANSENYFESQNNMDIYLFNKRLLTASRFMSNKVYAGATIQNIIGQMLTESKHPRVLMSRIENYKKYDEMYLPPNPTYKNLFYLDQYYGLYKAGANIFYDIDILYILNTAGKVTAKRENEITETIFMIPQLDSNIPGNAMVRQPENTAYYATVSEQELNHQKTSGMNSIASGGQTKVVLKDGTEIQKVDVVNTDEISANESVAFVNKDNVFAASVIEARATENEDMLYISANNLDINAFTPNKIFRVVYDEQSKNQKYNGIYRLAYAYHCIRAESEEYQSCSHHIVLKKTK